jgi:peptide/nickel transport system ATP-binding protein
MANLIVEGLSVHADSGGPQLLREVSFSLATGERRALVGRSGAGKSLVAASLIRLLRPPLVVTGGRAVLDGLDLLGLDQRRMRAHRGTGVFLLFQSPGSALNPCWDLRTLVTRAAERRNGKDAPQRAEQALLEVGLAQAADRYPFELSGGMRQRVLIAMALVLQPRLLVADEPTTGLDPQTQNEVLSSVDVLLQKTGASLLFITHDLRAAGVLCPAAFVLDRGRIVAEGSWGALRSRGNDARGLLESARSLES